MWGDDEDIVVPFWQVGSFAVFAFGGMRIVAVRRRRGRWSIHSDRIRASIYSCDRLKVVTGTRVGRPRQSRYPGSTSYTAPFLVTPPAANQYLALLVDSNDLASP